LLDSDSIKKNKKNRKIPSRKKQQQERKRIPFLILCQLYLATFAIKKIRSTVSPLAGPFYLLLRLLLCPGHPAYCVTYTWHSKLHSVTEEDFFLLCHLYLPQFIKNAGTISKKFNILPASAASQALQNPGKHHRTRQSTKKKSGKRAS